MEKSKNKYRCVVVEDEELIRRSIVRKINDLNCGFEVIGVAFDGKEALKLIEDKLPHLVITDIRMPVMGELELAEKIYYNYPSVKVVIISGYNEFEYAKQAIKYEVKEYLQKPITNDQLFITLTRIKMKFDSEIADIAKYFNLKYDRSHTLL
ncbi:response regulator [Caldicellulosiruptoraceae bacterium PP1]